MGKRGPMIGGLMGGLTDSMTGQLMKHELRLWWRRVTGVKQFWVWVILMGLVVASVLFLLWMGLSELRTATAGTELLGDQLELALWMAAGLWLIGFMFAFNQAMSESVVVLFERGDLDLLLSSPISNRAVFTVRLLSVALSVFFSFCVLVVPLSVLVVLIGFPALLGLYPALVSICLVAASFGLLVTLWVVRWVGARRARTLVQFLNLCLTLVTVLGFQAPNFLLSTGVELEGLIEQLQRWTAPGSVLSAQSWVWFPAKTLWFDPLSVVLTLSVSGAIALVTVHTLESAFTHGMQQSLTQKRRAQGNRAFAFKDGFSRVILAEEWRTMRRHPYLISQVALQVVLMVPLTWVILQGGEENSLFTLGRVVNVAMPVLGGQLSYALTYVCLSGEEAADLLKSAPASGPSLRRLKQVAALTPVWLLLLPAVLILIVQGYPWASAFVATLGASIGASFLRLWNSRPVALGDLFRRQKLNGTDLLLTLIESFAPWGWVGLGSALYSGSGVFVLLSVIGLVILFSLSYWRGRQLGSLLHY
ncbi:MAG: hypothetical protein AAFV90_04995 [Cyanobacteria bacterium J06634_5]